MATRSLIGRINGSIGHQTADVAYMHYDGYPNYMLPILEAWKKHHCLKTNIDLILDELGPASGLELSLFPNPNKEHTFEKNQPGIMKFYIRDRQDSDISSSNRYPYVDGKIYLTDDNNDCEYVYLINENNDIIWYELN